MKQFMIPTGLGHEQAFARLDAALLALGFEREFTSTEQLYVRFVGRKEVAKARWQIEGLPDKALLTIELDGDGLREWKKAEAEEALRKFIQTGESSPLLNDVNDPGTPFISSTALVSPYPRLPRRRNFFQTKKRGLPPIQFELNQSGRVAGAAFKAPESRRQLEERLRAFALYMEWNEIKAPPNKFRFVRGDRQTPMDHKGGKFLVPAVLTIDIVEVYSKSLVLVTLVDFDVREEAAETSFFLAEVQAFKAFVASGTSPSVRLRSTGMEKSSKMAPAWLFPIASLIVIGFCLNLYALVAIAVPLTVFLWIMHSARSSSFSSDLDETQKLDSFIVPVENLEPPKPPPSWYDAIAPKVDRLSQSWVENSIEQRLMGASENG